MNLPTSVDWKGKSNINDTDPTTGGFDVGHERAGDSGARIVGAPIGSAKYAAGSESKSRKYWPWGF